ncbi:MAG: CHAT domain-containing protein [Terriglobales bacterium]
MAVACAAASDEQKHTRFVPPEMQVSDNELRTLVESVRQQSGCGSLDHSISVLHKAQELASSRKLISDRALIEDALGGLYFANGKLNDARQMFQSAFEDAVVSANVAVQADVLVALSLFEQVKEKRGAGFDLLQRALDTARKSRSRYVESRVLGELGRYQVASGQYVEARRSLQEALQIDEVNGYDWLAGHKLYLAWLLAAENKLDEALEVAKSARSLAARNENYLVFVQASTSMAQGLIRKGQLDTAVLSLENLRNGVIDGGAGTFNKPEEYRCALNVPALRLMILEALAPTYQAAKRPDAAAKTWLEVYQLSEAQGTTLLAAEAAHALGDYALGTKDNQEAARYYSAAAAQWKALGNDDRYAAALIGIATSSFNLGNDPEGIRRLEELLPVSERQGNRILQFSAELELGRAFYRAKTFEKATQHLVRAEELADSLAANNGFDKKTLVGLYLLLANCYESLHETFAELLALENGVAISAELNDKLLLTFYDAVQQGLNNLLKAKSPESLLGAGELFDAFVLSELRYNFEYTKAIVEGRDKAWLKEDHPDTARMIALPDQIAWQLGGPEKLEAHLLRAGTVGSFSRGAILLALARRYAVKGDRPELAEKYSRAALALYGGSPQTSLLAIYAKCYLAASLARLGRDEEAQNQAAFCLEGSRQSPDSQLTLIANATAAFVYSVARDGARAKEALNYLLAKNPADPGLCEQLADAYGQLRDFDKQLTYLQKALDLHAKAGSKSSVADVQIKLAQLLSAQFPKRSKEAEDHFRNAATGYAALRDTAGESRALLVLANYYSGRQQYAKADETFGQALAAARRSEVPQLSAEVLSQWGDEYLNAGKAENALSVFRQAADSYRQLKLPSLEALSLRGAALSLRRLHRSAEAFDVATNAIAVADAGDSWYARYWTRRVLAWICSDQGKYTIAIKAVREAREISEVAHQNQLAGWAALSLTYLLHVIGDWQGALSETNFAIRTFHDLRDTEYLISAYSTLVDTYGSRESPLKDFSKALAAYEEASKLSSDISLTADLDLSAVEVLWQMGKYDEARRLCAKTIDYFKSSKNPLGEANALMSLAEVQRSSGNIRDASRSLAAAESLLGATDDLYTVGRFHYGKAGLLKQEGRLTESIREYEQVIDIAEQVKAGAQEESQRTFAENYGFIYDELIDALFVAAEKAEPKSAREYAARAFGYGEANKARVFLNTWGRVFANAARKHLPSELREKERGLSSKIELISAQLQDAKDSTQAALLRQQLSDANRDLQQLIEELRARYPDYAQLQYPTKVAISHVPLGPGEMLLEFKVADKATFVWVIRGTESGSVLVEFYKSPISRELLRGQVKRIRDGLNSGRPDDFEPRLAEELFEMLFPAGHATSVLQAQSLIIVPDDYLSLIPFEVLSPTASRNQFVFAGIATKYFPSAGAVIASRIAQHETQWSRSFLGIGDPITSAADERFPLVSAGSLQAARTSEMTETPQLSGALKTRGLGSLERLPATASEVRAIANLFATEGQADLRIGPAANKARLLATDLKSFRFVHFATHGLLPEESGLSEPLLVLSYDGHGIEDMVLSMSEIPELNLGADMVVLSACNTGTGAVSRAEGVFNLGRGFLAAGASSVVVSLWQVADKSTELLMQELYKNILSGKPKSDALLLARRSLASSKAYSSPFYWAPFILTGD